MAAEPERALHVLQRNDPATTEVCIFLFHEPDDLAISHALLGNQNVTYVSVNLTLFDSPRTPFTVGPDNNQGWSSLRRVLSTKQLERITLLGDFKLKGFRPPSQIVKLFLDAVQQNDKVSQVDLVNLKLPGPETAALVNNMTCPIFALRECTIHGSPDEKKKGALAIAEALKKNLTIEAFLFCPKLTAPFMLEIVERLASKKHLQWFAMGLTVTPTKHKERKERNKWYNILIQPYINATSNFQNVQKVEFFDVDVGRETCFQSVLSAIGCLRASSVKITLGSGLDVDWNLHLPSLLAALQRNHKLLSVAVTDEHDNDVLGAAATAQIRPFLERNQRKADRLAAFVADPLSVPANLWPLYVAAAQKDGVGTVWQSLHTLGPAVGGQGKKKKTRKRKRTQFYDPSAAPDPSM